MFAWLKDRTTLVVSVVSASLGYLFWGSVENYLLETFSQFLVWLGFKEETLIPLVLANLVPLLLIITAILLAHYLGTRKKPMDTPPQVVEKEPIGIGEALRKEAKETKQISEAYQRAKKAAEKARATNPLEIDDEGTVRYFSWRGRTENIDSIPIAHQPSQLYQFAKDLCDKIRSDTNVEPLFSTRDHPLGEIVWELSKDRKSKWQLLGGNGMNGEVGDQLLQVRKKR